MILANSRASLLPLWRYAIAQCTNLWNLILNSLRKQRRLSQEDTAEKSTRVPTPKAPPRHITYWPVPGSWQRREHPNWSNSVFQVPENPPHGTIYYVTKGKQISCGATAHVELLPSGHVIKYPKSNPYNPTEEDNHRRDMRTEAEIYQRIGECPYVPKLIDWDPESCCLTLENFEKGNLAVYLTSSASISSEIRRQWTLQAASAVSALHMADVIHCDVAPRNFLLNGSLNLYIADFAGSSVAGSPNTIAAGARFQPPGWSWHLPAKAADDIFALGSVMYFIMVGEEPYAELLEADVEKLFREGKFPQVSHLVCGAVIQGCWDGSLETAQEVVNSLTALYTTTTDDSN
ncbi:kinase-like domain [Cordyceps militaris]|uniref:EKC/KEOPS complex subunit BUD32 n=1 Tax=Cordyceps militaris TaxID=73501 RepID=A0A2H4SSB3_CORMI|nr:kinase-like domain [Cordyceps militaris]